jgi:hypothetical protein
MEGHSQEQSPLVEGSPNVPARGQNRRHQIKYLTAATSELADST